MELYVHMSVQTDTDRQFQFYVTCIVQIFLNSIFLKKKLLFFG